MGLLASSAPAQAAQLADAVVKKVRAACGTLAHHCAAYSVGKFSLNYLLACHALAHKKNSDVQGWNGMVGPL